MAAIYTLPPLNLSPTADLHPRLNGGAPTSRAQGVVQVSNKIKGFSHFYHDHLYNVIVYITTYLPTCIGVCEVDT